MTRSNVFWAGDTQSRHARRTYRRKARGSVSTRQLHHERLEDRRVLSFATLLAAAPLVEAGSDATVNEGSLFTGVGSFQGSGAENWTARVDYGDGSGSQPLAIKADQTFELSHVFADDGVYPVTVSVTGDGGTSGVDTVQVTVNNVVPNLYVCGKRTVVEGAVLSIPDIGMFTDPGFSQAAAGTVESFTYHINWGDGSPVDTGDATVDVPGSSGQVTRGTFDGTHTYADDGKYTVALTVQDDDNGQSLTRWVTVQVTNAPPIITAVSLDKSTIVESESVILTGTFTDGGSNDTHVAVVDWGDGQTSEAVVDPVARTFSAEHQYLSCPPASPHQFTVHVSVEDNAGDSAVASLPVTVKPAPPEVEAGDDQTADEGQAITFAGSFTDKSLEDTHTIVWDFGDGTTASGTLTPTHTYADNGTYTVTLTVTDSSRQSATDTLTATIANVDPTLTVVGAQTIAEGALLELAQLGQFTDPGFTNAAGGTSETFSYFINWGDGTAAITGEVEDVQQGSAGVPTQGTFGGSHVYASEGSYIVTVILSDDDGGADTGLFNVTVTNVAPTLTVVGNQTTAEGTMLQITDIGQFTDPGFANPLRPGTEREETFTYSIDWGDGTAASTGIATIDHAGAAGTPTAGSFDGSHVYADNGTYVVTVTVSDDDGGTASESFQVTVSNVAPTLGVIGNQTATAGVPLNLTDIGVFTDPGFANPLNPTGEVAETFTYTIDWGDDTPPSSGAATIDQAGSAGVFTSGSFDGSHTYAAAGTYVVTVRVTDDDGDYDEQQFDVVVVAAAQGEADDNRVKRAALSAASPVTVSVMRMAVSDSDNTVAVAAAEATGNQPPIVWGPGNLTLDEGPFTVPALGAFMDFDSSGPFRYSIDWEDGTGVTTGTANIELPGPPTAGSFDGEHVYRDDGVFEMTLSVTDEQGGTRSEVFEVTVNNVLPQFEDVVITTPISEGGTATLTGRIVDPGTGDRHTLVVDWGDGETNTYQYGAGTSSFRETHRYANNRPQDAPFTVRLELTDDDEPDTPTTVELEMLVKNMPPTAVDDIYVHVGGGDLVVDAALGVLANDTDPGNDALAVCEYGAPSAGTLVGLPDGSFVYTPPSDDFSGIVRFTYTAIDSDGAVSANEATVTIDSALSGSISGIVHIPFVTNSFEIASIGIPGVTITLTEATSQGVITTTTITGDDGSYRFGGLRVGTYTVTETHPAALRPGGVDSRQVVIGSGEAVTGVDFVDGWLNAQTLSLRNSFASAPSLQAVLTPQNVRLLIARAEEQAGHTKRAAAIRAGGSQTTVFVTGTEGDDTIRFSAGPTHHRLFVNNHAYIFVAAEVESFRIDGAGGNDSVRLTGSSSADVVTLRPAPALSTLQLPDYTLRGIDYRVTLANAEYVTVEGGGGYDRAYLYDSPGDDLLELGGESARLASWGTNDYLLEALDFDWIRVSGTAGGQNAKQLNSAIDFVLETEGRWLG